MASVRSARQTHTRSSSPPIHIYGQARLRLGLLHEATATTTTMICLPLRRQPGGVRKSACSFKPTSERGVLAAAAAFPSLETVRSAPHLPVSPPSSCSPWTTCLRSSRARRGRGGREGAARDPSAPSAFRMPPTSAKTSRTVLRRRGARAVETPLPAEPHLGRDEQVRAKMANHPES